MKILNGISPVSLNSTRYLSEAFKSLGYESDIMIYKKSSLLTGYEDKSLNIDIKNYLRYPVYSIKVIKFFVESIKKYDVFHFHAGYSLLPGNIDLRILKNLNKKIFMEYHGSEVRRASIYSSKNPYSHNLGRNMCCVEDEKSYKMQKRIAKYVDGIIVHDHELKEQLYDFNTKTHILPLRINLKKFQPCFSPGNKKIKIVHAPSHKDIKGTRFIVQAIVELEKEYEIEFQLIEKLSNNDALQMYKTADIIIDQLLVGSYGMFSIESMAYGKPTICYIRDDLLNTFPENPPVVNANVDNIKTKIEELISSAELRYKLGLKSREYIEKYHDSNIMALDAIKIYQS